MLWLCITLPQLPLEALQCEQRELPTVVTVLEGSVRSVVCCNPAAERVGLKPAMNFTTALAVLLPNELRGLAVGAFIAFGGLIAFGVAPSLVVAVSEWFGGERGLGSGLAVVGFAVSALGALGFYLAYRKAPQPVR